MAKSFLGHLAKITDKEIKHSIKEAERRRKKEEKEAERRVQTEIREQHRLAKEAEKKRIRIEKQNQREAEKHQKALEKELHKLEKEAEREEKKAEREAEKTRKEKQKILDKINNYTYEASAAYITEDFNNAVKFCENILLLDTYNEFAYENLIKYYHEMKDYESEEDVIVEALNKNLNNAEYEDKLIQVAKILTQ